MIHFLVAAEQAFSMREFLEGRGRALAERIQIVDYESLPARTSFARGTYVLSGLDQLSPGMLRLVDELHSRLSIEEGVRFLNHPRRTLRRFELLETLRQAGRNDFRAVRATGDFSSLRYPVFLRSERQHNGIVSPLLRSAGEVRTAIGVALVRGHRRRDLLVVEFCPTTDAEGLYRKFGAWIIGNRIIPRSLAVSRHWMIKGRGTEASRAIVLEDLAYGFDNPHEVQLAEVFAIAGVQHGRIDYAVTGGRIQTWEINLTPTIGQGEGRSSRHLPEELQRLRAEGREHFFRAFVAAWEAVDLSAPGLPAIPITFDPATRRAALEKEAAESPLLRMRKRLRPLDRFMRPVALRALPLVGWIARWFPSR